MGSHCVCTFWLSHPQLPGKNKRVFHLKWNQEVRETIRVPHGLSFIFQAVTLSTLHDLLLPLRVKLKKPRRLYMESFFTNKSGVGLYRKLPGSTLSCRTYSWKFPVNISRTSKQGLLGNDRLSVKSTTPKMSFRSAVYCATFKRMDSCLLEGNAEADLRAFRVEKHWLCILTLMTHRSRYESWFEESSVLV